MESKIIYYENELEDEFSEAKIIPRKIDETYRYSHHFLWDFCSMLIQNVFSMPIKYLYAKIKFHHCVIGREKLKSCRKTGYFMYVNHTQEFADTFLPSLANFPKRNFFIVNPENVSMKGLKVLVPLLGAIPVPGTLSASKNFRNVIQEHIRRRHSITIYPEAHIWPYYTKIRPYKDVSFQYPVEMNVPIFTITNTYQKGKKEGKVMITSYVDGPFYPVQRVQKKEAKQELRDRAYHAMQHRSQNSTYEQIHYVKRDKREMHVTLQ